MLNPRARGGESRRVEVHVIAAPSVGPLAPQQWLQRLKKLPIDNLRISTGTGKERPTVDSGAGSLRVVGVLQDADTLQVVGARFSSRQTGQLATWLANLAQGADQQSPTRYAFGLTSQQLLAVHDALSMRTATKTRGTDTIDALDQLITELKLAVTITPAAQRALQEPFPVADELQGLSHGTTLAALLRPVGLFFYPDESGKTLTIELVSADDGPLGTQESWPVGWPLAAKPRDAAPSVYRKTEISFENVELDRVLEALRQRMDVPIVLDQNGMARKEIEISTVRVSLWTGRTYYKRALEVALRQAKLRAELRIDEAGKPFFWVFPRTIRHGE